MHEVVFVSHGRTVHRTCEDFDLVPPLHEQLRSPLQVTGQSPIEIGFGGVFGGQEGNPHSRQVLTSDAWSARTIVLKGITSNVFAEA